MTRGQRIVATKRSRALGVLHFALPKYFGLSEAETNRRKTLKAEWKRGIITGLGNSR